MNKRDYFILAMAAGCYKHKAWILEAFSVVVPTAAQDNAERHPLQLRVMDNKVRVFRHADGHWGEPVDGPIDEPMFSFHESVKLSKGDLANLDRDVTTTYGNALFNAVALVYPFGSKVSYLEGRIKADQVEAIVQSRMVDNPTSPNDITVDEYLKFGQAMFSLVGLTQLCVPSATPKTMTPDPRMNEIRAKLLDDNKGHLNDPVVIAKIDAALVEADRKWLKGDLGEGFYIKDKSYTMVRKKLYGMLGGEDAFGDGTAVTLLEKSLNDGWDIYQLPTMISSLREASFNRGQQTELAGSVAKEINRYCTNFSIREDDCGTHLGLLTKLDEFNYKGYIGKYAFADGKEFIATEGMLKNGIGTVFEFRSPIYCKTSGIDFCKHCCGANLAQTPNAIGSYISDIGSNFLQDFLASANGRTLASAKWDLQASIM
jgi:hypothetical protein